MVTEDIAIIVGGEELPTDEKVRFLTVELLAKEERDRIKLLQEKVEKLVEMGAVSPEVASRLDLVFASLEKIAERIDSIKRPYDLDLVTEDLRNRLSGIVQGLDDVSSSVTRKLDSSLQRFDSRASAIMDSVSSMAYMKNDVQSAILDLESHSQNMDSRLGSLSENMKNFISAFDKKLDDLGRISASLDVLKEEVEMSVGDAAAKLQSQSNQLSSAVSEISAAKAEFVPLQNSIKEANIKLSILIDSVEQKVFELSAVFDNVEKIEKGIESQTDSMKNIVSFLREFIEHAEEKSIRLDNTLVDFAAFTDRMNEEMKKALELIDERSGMLEIAARELSGLRSQMDAKFEDLESIKAELSEAVYSLNRNAPLMEKAAADMLDVRSLVSGSADRLEASAGELEKMAQQSGDFLAAQRSAASELKSAAAAAEKAMKSLKEIQEDLKETSKSVDRKTDDILNVLMRKVSELSKVNETIEKNSSSMISAAATLERMVDKISAMPQVKAIRPSARKKARPRKKAKPKARSRVVGAGVARRTKPRPRKARRTKRIAVRRRRARKPARNIRAENEALDLLILNTLKNVSMNMTMLEEATNTREIRLRKRLSILVARGVVGREKRGRAVFYTSRVETVA